MLTLDTIIARVPMLLRCALAALVLCGLILVIVVQRAAILRSGQEVRLETAPVDPRDLFRGDYVVLDYRIGTVNPPSNVTTSFRRQQRVFVTLRPDESGKAKAVAIAAEQPAVTGNDIVIAGFILGNQTGMGRVIIRGIGPSLAPGVTNPLANPTLELRDNNGSLVRTNNDWQDDPAQAAELTNAALAPTNNLESGIAATLPPGMYTALLAGLNNGTGIGLVEVYDRGL